MTRKNKNAKYITAAIAAAAAIAGAITGCNSSPAGNGDAGTANQDTETTPVETTEFVPEIAGVYEAEDAEFTGNVKADKEKPGYSGTGYAAGFSADDDACEFSIDIKENGFYDLVFTTASNGGYKENYVFVDGESVGNIASENSSFTDTAVNRVYLETGTHEILVQKYWGWIMLDKLTVQTSKPIDEGIYNVSAELVNKNAAESAKRLMSYLTDIYGEKILRVSIVIQVSSERNVRWLTRSQANILLYSDLILSSIHHQGWRTEAHQRLRIMQRAFGRMAESLLSAGTGMHRANILPESGGQASEQNQPT